MRGRVITSIVLAMTVTGCAGWNKGAPSCDGSAKRPLNKSLWDWETNPPVAPLPEALPVKRLGNAMPSASTDSGEQRGATSSSFDAARSLLPCNVARRHG